MFIVEISLQIHLSNHVEISLQIHLSNHVFICPIMLFVYRGIYPIMLLVYIGIDPIRLFVSIGIYLSNHVVCLHYRGGQYQNCEPGAGWWCQIFQIYSKFSNWYRVPNLRVGV